MLSREKQIPRIGCQFEWQLAETVEVLIHEDLAEVKQMRSRSERSRNRFSSSSIRNSPRVIPRATPKVTLRLTLYHSLEWPLTTLRTSLHEARRARRTPSTRLPRPSTGRLAYRTVPAYSQEVTFIFLQRD